MSRVAPVLLALALAGCTTTHVHVFGAYLYDKSQDCLEKAAGVDVIDGPDPGICAQKRCWISPGGDVYVTDAACDAPPFYVDHTTDAERFCVRALAAYARARCPADDGGT